MGELNKEVVVAKNATVQTEGKRKVERDIAYYNLDMIISVGYRVHSYRGVQFRQWATAVLKEYIKKGFVLNDEPLKNAGRGNYFDELLARILNSMQAYRTIRMFKDGSLLDYINVEELCMLARTWMNECVRVISFIM